MEFPDAILFDLDGVLLDTEPLLGNAWREAAMEFNYNLTDEKLKILKGRRRIDCAKKVYNWINKKISINELLAIQKLKAKNQLKKAKPFTGAIDLIKFCIEIKLPIALVTSSSTESFNLKTSTNPWLKLFKIKILGDSEFVYEGKPSPEPYLRAIKILDVNPSKTWVIEDSYAGSISGLKSKCNLYYFSKDLEVLNKLIEEFDQDNIQKINELSEIIYYLKLLKGF